MARPWTEHPDLPRDADAPLGDGIAAGNVGCAQHLWLVTGKGLARPDRLPYPDAGLV